VKPRRPVEEMSMSFLDVICCGFGAVILLLMTTKFIPPTVLETSPKHLNGTVVARQDSLFQIRGETEKLQRELSDKQRELDGDLASLAALERELSQILGKFQTSKSEAEEAVVTQKKLAEAKQSLSEEMERLLGAGFQRSDNTVAGIAADSEYVVFVIDTSGSMFNYAWPMVTRKLGETLAVYPALKGIQVMSDQGEYMFPQYAGKWIPDSPARRRAILERMKTFNPFSLSSPVNGIEKAVRVFQGPDRRISVYVFGDDFTGNSVEEVVDQVDKINAPDANGKRPVRINAVGMPTLFHANPPPASLYRFAALMRELTYRNNGTFVGLPDFR
jgi:hypothetical protein